MTFRNFLMKHRQTDTWLGDLAKDCGDWKGDTLASFEKYLHTKSQSIEVWRAFKLAEGLFGLQEEIPDHDLYASECWMWAINEIPLCPRWRDYLIDLPDGRELRLKSDTLLSRSYICRGGYEKPFDVSVEIAFLTGQIDPDDYAMVEE